MGAVLRTDGRLVAAKSTEPTATDARLLESVGGILQKDRPDAAAIPTNATTATTTPRPTTTATAIVEWVERRRRGRPRLLGAMGRILPKARRVPQESTKVTPPFFCSFAPSLG